MKKPSSPLRPAKRIPASDTPDQDEKLPAEGVALELDAHALLGKGAKKFKLSNKEFASAAIRNYAERGLDPTKTTVLAEAAKTRSEINESGHSIRKHLTEVGAESRRELYELEHDRYEFMLVQQNILMTYLRRIETNLLAQQTATQTQFLLPILEHLIGVGAETHLTRTLLEELLLRVRGTVDAVAELAASSRQHDAQIITHKLRELEKLLEELNIEQPAPAVYPLASRPKLRMSLPDDELVP